MWCWDLLKFCFTWHRYASGLYIYACFVHDEVPVQSCSVFLQKPTCWSQLGGDGVQSTWYFHIVYYTVVFKVDGNVIRPLTSRQKQRYYHKRAHWCSVFQNENALNPPTRKINTSTFSSWKISWLRMPPKASVGMPVKSTWYQHCCMKVLCIRTEIHWMQFWSTDVLASYPVLLRSEGVGEADKSQFKKLAVPLRIIAEQNCLKWNGTPSWNQVFKQVLFFSYAR